MNNKFYAPISIVGLFIIFGIVSFLVIITKRHPFWIHKKLKIGALLIYLTSASVGCPIVSCYAQVVDYENIIDIDQQASENTIITDLAVSDTISGNISYRISEKFSFAIIDSLNTPIQTENLQAVDGSFDEDSEEFKFELSNKIVPGSYTLNFYNIEKNSVLNYNNYLKNYVLKVRP